MATIYTTKQFETVDLVCMAHYGRTADVTEAVLDANPGLSAFGPILPMGTKVTLPEIKRRTATAALVSLYN